MDTNTIHKQHYDVNKAVWLYHQDDIKRQLYDKCKNEKELEINIEKLNKFLLNIVWNDGLLKVNYQRNNSYGRWFSNGIQGISRKVRGFLLHNKDVIDIDMKNAHPVLLRHLKKVYNININTPFLDEYIFNREQVFKNHFNNKKEYGKNCILVATNCDELNTNNNWLNSYFRDVCLIRDKLKNVNDLKELKKNIQKKKNQDGSFMNHILCKWEEIIINDVITFFQEKDYSMFSYMMDGIMIYSKPEWENDLNELNKFIQQKYDTTFIFINKPIENENNITEGNINDDMIQKMMDMGLSYEEQILNTYDYETIKTKLWEHPDYYNAVRIKSMGMYYIRKDGQYYFFDENKLKTSYKHLKVKIKTSNDKEKKVKFINLWVEDENINHKMEIVNKHPTHVKNDDDVYNIWEPFEIENIELKEYREEAVNMFINHIDILFNHNDEHREFMLNWFSHIYKYPEKKTEVMPLIVGEEGTGKDTLVKFMYKLMGRKLVYKSVKPQTDVLGQFNGVLAKTRFIHFSETGFKNTKDGLNILKDIITAETIDIEYKGKDKAPEADSYHNFILLSNSSLPIPIEKDSSLRRFVMFYVSNTLIGNNEYFTAFHNMLNDEMNMRSIYEYLITRKETPYLFNKTNIPVTEYQKGLMETFESDDMKWFKDFTTINKYNTNRRFKPVELFEDFTVWLNENHIETKYSIKKFGMFMTKLCVKFEKEIVKGHSNGVFYEIDFENLNF